MITSVLVIDNEVGLVDLYRAFLVPEYEVKTATSGAEVLQVGNAYRGDTLLDLQMPAMSDDYVLTEMRERGLNCPVGL